MSPASNGQKATSKKHSCEQLLRVLEALCALAALHDFDKSYELTPIPELLPPSRPMA